MRCFRDQETFRLRPPALAFTVITQGGDTVHSISLPLGKLSDIVLELSTTNLKPCMAETQTCYPGRWTNNTEIDRSADPVFSHGDILYLAKENPW